MPGPNRRLRRLKQTTDLASIGEFSSVNPVDGDILIYDSGAGVYENGRSLTGNYSIAGALTATDLTVTNDVTIQDALTVQGNTNLNAALAVLGTATFNSSVTVATTLDVTGATTLSSTLSVAGSLSGSGFSFTGNGQIDGNLNVGGTLTAGTVDLTAADVTVNALTVTTSASVGTDLSVGNNITATGAMTAASGAVAGDFSSGGTISANDALCVSGAFCLQYDPAAISPEGMLVHTDEDALIGIYGTETGAVDPNLGQQPVALFDPNAGFTLGFNGITQLSNTTNSIAITDTAGVAPFVSFHNSSSTRLGLIQATTATNDFRILNEVADSEFEVQLTDGTQGAYTAYRAMTDHGIGHRFYTMESDNNDYLCLEVSDSGIVVQSSALIGEEPQIIFRHSNGTTLLASINRDDGTDNALVYATHDGSHNAHVFRGLNAAESANHDCAVFDPDGSVDLYYNNFNSLSTTGDGMRLFGNGAGNNAVLYLEDGDTEVAQIYKHASDGSLYVQNTEAGQDIRIRARNALDTLNANALLANYDTVTLNYQGGQALQTTATGVSVRSQSADCTFLMEDEVGNDLFRATTSSDDVFLDVLQAGKDLVLRVDTTVNAIRMNSGSSIQFYHNGVNTITTTANGFDADTGTTSGIYDFIVDSTVTANIGLRSNLYGVRMRMETDGDFRLRQTTAAGGLEDIWIQCIRDSAVELYWNGIKEAETVDGGFHVNGLMSFGDQTELTIATGAVTATSSYHRIDTEADAATDDLDTITYSGQTGTVLVISAIAAGRTVVAKDATGNLQLAGDFSMTSVRDTLTLLWNGSNWLELSRSTNG